ncbi:hypothetical protein [Sulfurimonas sp.]
MKKKSEYSIEKKRDYFAELEQPKFDINIIFDVEPKKENKKKIRKNKISNTIVETPTMKLRKEELKAVIDEINLIKAVKETAIELMEKPSYKNRRIELINSKKILHSLMYAS